MRFAIKPAPGGAGEHGRHRGHHLRGGALGSAAEHARAGRHLPVGRGQEVLAGHCATIGRDVSEITCSVNVPVSDDIDAVVATATTFRDAAVDLAILNLPHHAAPESLAPLAAALTHLS
jgi:hypothetical protein